MKAGGGGTAMNSALRDFGFDDQSVDFSVDPDMYTKLDVKKAKLGEENPFDVEKIYQFQLNKDITKLISKKGKYVDRNNRFLEMRKVDEEYKRVAVPQSIATHGNFIEILEYTAEESWKATSRPYGEQAHKRYLYYMNNIPPGPSDAEIQDKAQRKMDKELWEKIITGKTDLTKKEIQRRQQLEIERLEKEMAERNELDHMKHRRLWREKIAKEDFPALRKRPTEREWNESMEHWSKGIHYPYDMSTEGFPFVKVDMLEGTQLIKERNKDESMAPERKYSSEKYIAGNEGAEKEYMEHMVGINLGKVDKYLKKRRKDIIREQEMEAELKQIREKQRRRAARVERHDMKDAIITAKFNTIQGKNQKIKKIKTKKPGLLDVEKSQEEVIEPSDDEWSDESSGVFGGANAEGSSPTAAKSKKGEEKEEEETDGVANIGTGYQRQHTGINLADIQRLHEQMNPTPSKKKFAIGGRRGGGDGGEGGDGGGSPSASPSGRSGSKRRVGVNESAVGEGGGGGGDGDNASGSEGGDQDAGNDGNAAPSSSSPKRRGLVNIPALTGIGGNSGKSGKNKKKSTAAAQGGDSGSDNDASGEEEGSADGAENVNDEGKGDDTAKKVNWDTTDHASLKYSSKYKDYSFNSGAYLPDYVRNVISNNFVNFGGRKSGKVAPSAYAVKNIKQRNIVLRVVIHYAKKVHPRRLLHLAIRGYRRWQKFYEKNFTNPDGLTRSERQKLATLRKLDLLTQDASSVDYHKSIVNLAETEIPSEEFLKAAKRKQRKFNEEIKKLEDKGHLDADEQRHLDMLRRRLELHNEIYEARLKRERKATQRAGLIKRYIADTRALVEATSNFTFLDRWRIYIRTMKQDMVQRTVQLKNNKTQEHILPEYEKDANNDLIESMYEARLQDRKKSAWRRKWKRRFRYMITRNERDLEDEDVRVRDVDDLILAARAGNYIEVLEIICHPTHPVSPNQLNEDGITATYATLMMILKREVLDSEADIANAGLSKWERFLKALKKKVELEPKLDLVLRALLYAGGKVDFQKIEAGVDGTAVMHSAAETGALDMIDWLLKKGTDINIRTAIQKKTPLMVALEHNQLEVVDLLLKRGVMMHLELKDEQGWTALHYAACFARVELAVILMTCGAKTNIRNNAGRLASEEARARGRTEVATAIMTFKSDVVVVRTRLDNLMNRTDANFRKHRQRQRIHEHEQTQGATVQRPGSAPRMTLRGAAGGRPRLPPIQRGGQQDAPDAITAGADATAGAAPPGDTVGTEDSGANSQLIPGPSGDPNAAKVADNTAELQAKAAAAAEAQKREAYERRMSSIVAAADPWNMGQHTKPKQSRLAAMSFYSKPKSTTTTGPL